MKTKDKGRGRRPGAAILVGGLLGTALLFAGGFSYAVLEAGAADEEAFKVATLDAPAGTAASRFRVTGDEDPARAIFENSSVGIGVSAPGEKLDIAGAIKVGAADNQADGTIRWTGTDFEGRKGGQWVSLTAGTAVAPSGSAVMLFGIGRRNFFSSARFLVPGFDFGISEAEETRLPVTRAGTVKNMYLVSRTNTLPGGGTMTYTLRKNGVDTALSLVVAGGQTEKENLIDTVQVAAGDALSLASTVQNGGLGEMQDILISFEFVAAGL